ncbi:cache domain-containing protein, partial [Cohaesibacter celericrescens]|uniref:cache domain-containing protein n=1 Tax=Cohaesibacter celericrescens TaxID=2067669 RepID=UPI00356678F0
MGTIFCLKFKIRTIGKKMTSKNTNKKSLYEKLTKGVMAKALLVATASVLVVFTLFSTYNDRIKSAETAADIEVVLKSVGATTGEGVRDWLDARIMLISSAADYARTISDGTDPVYLFKNKVFVENFLSSYIGMESDGATYLWPHVELPDDFDPRQRPWYKDAVKKNGVMLTEPYLDTSTHQMIISAAEPVKTNKGLKGVVAGDFAIKTIVDLVAETNFGGKGYAYLVSKDGKILVHNNMDLIGKTLADAYPNGAPAIAQDIVEVEEAGKTSLVTFVPIEGLPVDWYVALSMDKDLAYAALYEFRISAIVATLLAAVLMIVVLGFFLTKIVALPIQNMTGAMVRLADGDHDVDIQALGRKDEIGSMAEAVLVFKQNAIEQEKMRAQQQEEEQAKQRRVERVDQL